MDIYNVILEEISNIIIEFMRENHIKTTVNGNKKSKQILMDFFDNGNRWIIPKSRDVYLSQELKGNLSTSSPYFQEFNAIIEGFKHGDDLNYNQTRKIFNSTMNERDILLNAWGITHIHLGKIVNSKTGMRKNRSEYLLFCMINDTSVFCIDVLKHPSLDEFFCYNLLKIIHNNGWMLAFGFLQMGDDYVPGSLTPKITNDRELTEMYIDKKKNLAFEFEGMAYFRMNGLVSTGDSMSVTSNLIDFIAHIRNLFREEDEFVEFKMTRVNLAPPKIEAIVVIKREDIELEVVI